jgi:hypothetical protein
MCISMCEQGIYVKGQHWPSCPELIACELNTEAKNIGCWGSLAPEPLNWELELE